MGEESEFTVPEAYQNVGWVKDVKSYDDLWKKTDGAEKLVGQRLEGKVDLPKENATPEDMATFYKSVGRPETAEEYKFDREGQAEALKEFNSDKMDSIVKTIFHNHGLRPDQALGIQKDYEKVLGEQLIEKLDVQKKLNDGFEELTSKIFGNDKEAILESSKLILGHYAPEGFADHISKLPNETLVVIASVLNGIKKDYISEDDFKTLGNKKPTSDQSESSLREQAKKLMESDEWTNEFHRDHAARVEEVNAIYNTIGQME